MAKLYDFRIVVRRAEFSESFVTVAYSGRSSDVYREECIQATLADAIARRKEMSDAESRPHAATLMMKYRDDRKPPGFSKVETIYKER